MVKSKLLVIINIVLEQRIVNIPNSVIIET
jgi:hypothetical protein